jgi:ribonuclease BN (tRNA processing enzyme)
MGFHLHVLGSGTAIPHPDRGASGYACIAEDGTALLLECGPGSTRRWPADGLTFDNVRCVAVSHHHLDHCSDLAAVMFGRNVPDPPVSTPLLLLGPTGHARLVGLLEEAYGDAVTDRGGGRRVQELGDGEGTHVAGFDVLARVVAHTVGALGFRVRRQGSTLAFSGDSAPCDALVELCRGADLALLECSYPAGRDSSAHLNATTAGQVARDAGVGRLVLTHFYPECDGADLEGQVRAAGYRGELHLARDGARYVV